MFIAFAWYEIIIFALICLSIGSIIGIFTIAMCQAAKKGEEQ